MGGEKTFDYNLVQSVDRALSIIESLAKTEGGTGITELSQKLDMHKSTIHRILATLAHKDFVEQDLETGKYKLGFKIFEISRMVLNEVKLCNHATPFLEKLAQKTEETTILSIVNEKKDALIISNEAVSPQTVTTKSYIGRRMPLHTSSCGKVFLAYLPEEELERLLSQTEFKPFTPKTITSRDKLMKELPAIRSQGFAISIEEYQEGINCLSTPIRDAQGKVIATLGTVGPSFRLTLKRCQEIVKDIKETGAKISRSLGYQPEENP